MPTPSLGVTTQGVAVVAREKPLLLISGRIHLGALTHSSGWALAQRNFDPTNASN
jgi:hypothetical protein